MNTEAIQKIIDALEKNGGAALDALASYTAATVYGDIVITILAPFILIILIYCFSKFAKKLENVESDTVSEKLYIFGTISTGVVSCFMIIIVLTCFLMLSNNIAAIKNPKGAAIYSLLKK